MFSEIVLIPLYKPVVIYGYRSLYGIGLVCTSIPPASEMTYSVSGGGGALNSTHSLTHPISTNVWKVL